MYYIIYIDMCVDVYLRLFDFMFVYLCIRHLSVCIYNVCCFCVCVCVSLCPHKQQYSSSMRRSCSVLELPGGSRGLGGFDRSGGWSEREEIPLTRAISSAFSLSPEVCVCVCACVRACVPVCLSECVCFGESHPSTNDT